MSVTENPDRIELSQNIEDYVGAHLADELLQQPFTRENFTYQADDIFGHIREAVEAGQPRSAGLTRAAELYVNDAEDVRLRLHAEVILGAPIAQQNQLRLNQIRQELQANPDAEQLKQAEQKLKRALCEYNHSIRSLIYENPDTFTRADLLNWLEKASGGNRVWAEQIVAGAAAEVATARALQEVPGVRNVELSSVDDDLRGVDLWVTGVNGTKRAVDLKYGGHQPLNGVEQRGKTTVIGLGSEAIDGFNLRPNYQPQFVDNYRNS